MKRPPPTRHTGCRRALFDARCKACWFVAGLLVLALASFASLDLQWRALASGEALQVMGAFVAEFFPPDLSTPMLQRTARAALETLAMSVLGTALAAAAGLVLALVAARGRGAALARAPRGLLNVLRSIPSWCGPRCCWWPPAWGRSAGTLALALHTSGVLGRLFAEASRTRLPGPAFALRASGIGRCGCSPTPRCRRCCRRSGQLHAVPLGKQHPRRHRAGRGGRRRPGPAAAVFHLGLFQMGKSCHRAGGHAGAGGAGRRRQLCRATAAGAVRPPPWHCAGSCCR
jgi:ABC-type amino acid transport system permease subunit